MEVPESGKEFSCLALAESVRDRALGAVGTVVDKISRAQITPSIPEKIAVMNFPHLSIVVTAQSDNLITAC